MKRRTSTSAFSFGLESSEFSRAESLGLGPWAERFGSVFFWGDHPQNGASATVFFLASIKKRKKGFTYHHSWSSSGLSGVGIPGSFWGALKWPAKKT